MGGSLDGEGFKIPGRPEGLGRISGYIVAVEGAEEGPSIDIGRCADPRSSDLDIGCSRKFGAGASVNGAAVGPVGSRAMEK